MHHIEMSFFFFVVEWNCLKARKRLGDIIGEIISERKEKKLLETERDLLSCLLNWKKGEGEILSDDQIADNIIGVLFAAQDTTATAMTWVVKYLHDEPKLLECVKVWSIEKGNFGHIWFSVANICLSLKLYSYFEFKRTFTIF